MRLERTYEELKQEKLLKTGAFRDKFRAYLWGIETCERHSGRIRVVMFRAYLWGIETTAHVIHFAPPSRLERTYEELKHFSLLIK